MKRLLKINLILLFPIQFIFNLNSCNLDEQNYMSFSLRSQFIDDVFKENDSKKINDVKIPLFFNYLNYSSNNWSYSGYNNVLASEKATKSIVNLQNVYYNKDEIIFLRNISSLFGYASLANEIDITGLTLNIENTFLRSINFNNANPNKLVINADMLVSIFKGWKIAAKSLISVTTEEGYFSNSDVVQFVNKVIFENKSNNFYNLNEVSDNKYYNYCVKNNNLNYDSIDNFVNVANNNLKVPFSNMNMEKLNFKKIIKSDIFPNGGFSIMGINYKIL